MATVSAEEVWGSTEATVAEKEDTVEATMFEEDVCCSMETAVTVEDV